MSNQSIEPLVEVDAKGEFMVSVKEPSASGYQWKLANNQPKFKILSSRVKRNTRSFGGSSKRIMKIKIVDDHPDSVSLVLVRPWEKNSIKRSTTMKLKYPKV
ncbi:protease inhibitor I42 family protein [Ruegeria sp. AU67]|uniref:protease inhibitor I42 family protein n=1 Tax=Ruegeria sp. AU67 TaxID=2108530 RepID=UPI000D696882|nr:protease inhibitor I42 family protein [Ruegeria sp. AU67]